MQISSSRPVAIRMGDGQTLRLFASEEIALMMLSKEGLLPKAPKEISAEDRAALFCEIPTRIRLKLAEVNPLGRMTPHDRRKLRKAAARGGA